MNEPFSFLRNSRSCGDIMATGAGTFASGDSGSALDADGCDDAGPSDIGARMVGRILVSLIAFAVAGFLLLVLIGLWDGYEQETKALGFSGIYERYLASQTGFADDAKGYRAVVEAESAQTVVAGTAAIEE